MEFSLDVDEHNGKITSRFTVGNIEPRFRDVNDDISSFPPLNNVDRSGILPPVVRYISRSGRHIILERPPHIARIFYYSAALGEIEDEERDHDLVLEEFNLPMPWTVYAIILNDRFQPHMSNIFAARSYIKSEADPLYLLPLPNSHGDGRFCTPYDKPWDITMEPYSIAQGIAESYDMLWSSNFNDDLNSAISSAHKQRKPHKIFDGSNPVRAFDSFNQLQPREVLSRWEQFSLQEVASWDDWPSAYWDDRDLNVANLMYYLRSMGGDYDNKFLFNMLRQRLHA